VLRTGDGAFVVIPPQRPEAEQIRSGVGLRNCWAALGWEGGQSQMPVAHIRPDALGSRPELTKRVERAAERSSAELRCRLDCEITELRSALQVCDLPLFERGSRGLFCDSFFLDDNFQVRGYVLVQLHRDGELT
jgi:hypothetical protein